MPSAVLIDRPENYLKNVYASARRCRGVSFAKASQEYYDQPDKAAALIQKLLDADELTPFEHGLFMFDISNISRACSHQIVRQRIASFCQESQQQLKTLDVVVPPAIEANPEAQLVFQGMLDSIHAAYEHLLKHVSPDEARYILPSASKTSLIVSFNGRSLLHFLGQRLCRCASDEIRGIAQQMLKTMHGLYPALFTTENVMHCRRCRGKCLKKHSHKTILETKYLKSE